MAQHKLKISLDVNFDLDCDDGVKLLDIVIDINRDVFLAKLWLPNGAQWDGKVSDWRIVKYEENTHLITAESTSNH